MIHDHIEEIEARISTAKGIPFEARTELLNLLSALKSEVDNIAGKHEEDAQSLARFVDASAHEATRQTKKPELLEAALQGLTSSVEDLEVSNPKLTQIVNRIAVALSNMGI